MSLSYFSYNQSEKLALPSISLLSEAIPILEDEWVPFLRCELCGRNAHCPYAERYEDGDYVGFNEIKCGVIAQSLRGLVKLSENEFSNLSLENQQKYLDALYYFTQYIIDSDSLFSSLQSPEELVENYGAKVGLRMIGGISRTRDNLNKACALLQNIPFVSSKRIMLLVEGASEAALVSRLIIRDSYFLHNVEVKSYGSESNKKYNVIRLLIQEYQSKGYHVLIQVDVDGKPDNLNEANYWGLKEHVNVGLIHGDDIFPFREDLEASYPPELLCELLAETFGLEPQQIYKAISEPKSEKNTLYKRLEDDLGFMPSKPKLAKDIADLVSDYDLVNNLDFTDNELVKFIKFLERRAIEI
ncbi:hypothetical protein HRO20_003508 [Vibrio cholerae]|nr:hypothetical protein [Vibrio cholerae]EJL6692059.1 hypothetical protein [Vibrio cholerae]EKK9988555.1 hypothetical protein [Vibrio vulnificus]ELP5730841.1 hypothetical protein [Vibrio vulnificus]